jgi:hypothetical protein
MCIRVSWRLVLSLLIFCLPCSAASASGIEYNSQLPQDFSFFQNRLGVWIDTKNTTVIEYSFDVKRSQLIQRVWFVSPSFHVEELHFTYIGSREFSAATVNDLAKSIGIYTYDDDGNLFAVFNHQFRNTSNFSREGNLDFRQEEYTFTYDVNKTPFEQNWKNIDTRENVFLRSSEQSANTLISSATAGKFSFASWPSVYPDKAATSQYAQQQRSAQLNASSPAGGEVGSSSSTATNMQSQFGGGQDSGPAENRPEEGGRCVLGTTSKGEPLGWGIRLSPAFAGATFKERQNGKDRFRLDTSTLAYRGILGDFFQTCGSNPPKKFEQYQIAIAIEGNTCHIPGPGEDQVLINGKHQECTFLGPFPAEPSTSISMSLVPHPHQYNCHEFTFVAISHDDFTKGAQYEVSMCTNGACHCR